jgi:hypothetical protein
MSRTVPLACALSLAIGLSFIFVRAPHPWGWEGFDGYYDLGLAVARGEPFPTMDRPWGYAYFLAAFYRVFGDRPVIPLVVQAALNAAMPLLVFLFARREFDERVAVVAAALTGALSFNTVYASTQAADAVCNVIFMAGVLALARARCRDDWRLYALAGVLLGTAPQFRPNLILVPPVLGAFLLAERASGTRAVHASIVVLASAALLMPWTVRNYRISGEIIPATTHGALQWWYGTLQSGPYLKSRAYNPRSIFEHATFPYTSLDRVPLIVSGRIAPCGRTDGTLTMVYWTDRDRTRRQTRVRSSNDELVAEVPPSPAPTTYYLYVTGVETSDESAPIVYFVSDDHLGDIDRDGDLLDVFDLIRLIRHLAWGEPVPASDRLDFDGDGSLSETDVALAVSALLTRSAQPHGAPPIRIDAVEAAATLRLADGSTIAVPRDWSGRITDVEIAGGLGTSLLQSTVSFALLRRDSASRSGRRDCAPLDGVSVNAPYYRAEVDAMHRYAALAIDNIRRDPRAYLAGAAYRAVRVFFIEASEDPNTVYQFSGSGRIYRAAQALSMVLLALCVVGIWAARRRGNAVALPLILIAYIPATLAFLLTNMRYSISVQPLMFVFVAAALVSAAEAVGRSRAHEETETIRRP